MGNTPLFCGAVLPHAAWAVNPSQFEAIRRPVKKTNAHDARAWALFFGKDR
jgi:hypothetical protein